MKGRPAHCYYQARIQANCLCHRVCHLFGLNTVDLRAFCAAGYPAYTYIYIECGADIMNFVKYYQTTLSILACGIFDGMYNNTQTGEECKVYLRVRTKQGREEIQNLHELAPLANN